jgi:uncharacterized membrane protein
MRAEKSTRGFGWRVYGLGVLAVGLACVAFGDFDSGQAVPQHFPARTALAYAAGAYMILSAAAVEWRWTVAWGAAALTFYYGLFVVILMDGRMLLTDYAVFGTYENLAIQTAIGVGALITYANTARLDASLAARVTRVGQLLFGVCALVFGGAHFVYMNLTAPLVPKWLPPTQEFWGYATGVCFLAAGVAIVTGVQARLAAILMTVMLSSFALLVHERMLLADHASHFNWTESAENLAAIGAAWVVADSLAPRRAARQ